MLKLLKGLPRSLATQQMMAVVSVMFVAVMWVGEAGNPGGGVWKVSESFGSPKPGKSGARETGGVRKKEERKARRRRRGGKNEGKALCKALQLYNHQTNM